MGFAKVVQIKTATAASATSVSLTLDSTPTEGNALIGFHHTGATSSSGITSSGWGDPVATLTNATENDESKIHLKIAGASEATGVTAEAGGTDEQMLIVMEIEGPFPSSSQIDVNWTGARSATASSYTFTGGTTSQNIELAVAFVMMRTQLNVTSNTWTNDFMQFGAACSSSAKSAAIAIKELSSTGSVSTAVTFNTANTCMGALITFKADTSVSAPTAYGTGYWTEIAKASDNNALTDVDPDPLGTADYAGSSGFASTITKWNGGVIRQKADDSIIEYIIEASGGHGDYYGNSGFNCDLLAETPAWARHRDPTAASANLSLNDTDGVDADSNAIARHTYGTHAYNYDDDEFIFFGGAALSGASAVSTSTVSRLAYGTSKTAWIHTGVTSYPGGGGGSSAMWAEYIGNDQYIIINQNAGTYHVYTKGSDTYTGYSTLNPSGSNTPGDFGGLWDSKRGRALIYGYDATKVKLFLPKMGAGHKEITTTSKPAGITISNQQCGGVYDSYIDKYVFWNGGQALYLLDPVTWVWSTMTLDTQTVTPTSPTTNGTYDRFRYIRPCSSFSQGGYIVVNATTESTYFYYVPNAASGSNSISVSQKFYGVGRRR